MTSEELANRTTLTVNEAAQILGIGRTLTYEHVRQGLIPAIRLGRRIVVPVPQLMAMLAATHGVQANAAGYVQQSVVT